MLGLEGGSAAAWSIVLRAAGSDAVLARYRAELGSAVSHEVEGREEHDLWQTVSDFSQLVQERHPASLLMSMTLPLADVHPVLNGLATCAESNGFALATVGRVGVGHLLVAVWAKRRSEAALVNFVWTRENRLSELRYPLPRDASMADPALPGGSARIMSRRGDPCPQTSKACARSSGRSIQRTF